MPRRETQFLSEYRYGSRGLLVSGDRFRVSGGPIYITCDGTQLSMAERGIFIFRRLCIQGAARWIEAYRADGGGMSILWVGKAGRSRSIPNLRRKPYRVSKIRAEQVRSA